MGGELGDDGSHSAGMGEDPFLGAALGFYDLLNRDTSTPQSQDLDEYDQVDFFPSTGSGAPFEPIQFLPASSVAHAAQRLRAAKEFQVAAHLQRLKGRVSARYAAIKSLQWTPKRAKLRDKLTFVMGVMLPLISAFWLGTSPSTFYKLYTIKAILLFALRFFLYRKSRMHYYLMDFCYYANLLMVVQVWLFQNSCAMEKIMFAFAMGPLAWSILAFRNSMIFHSLDKMTSLFLHVFPPLVAWATRWYPGDPNHWNGPEYCDHTEATVRELILVPGLPYALWAVAYYAKIFIISSKRIQERGYETLFKYITRNPRSLPGRFARSLPGWLAPIVFMVWHLVFCITCFVFSWLMWQHYWLNTIFIVLMLFVSAWNGGNYYFEVFVHRYLEQVGLPMKGAAGEGATLARSQSTSFESLGWKDAAQHDAEAAHTVVRSHSESAMHEEEATWADAVDASWEMLDRADLRHTSQDGLPRVCDSDSLTHRAVAGNPVEAS